jgi:hypothetical protein
VAYARPVVDVSVRPPSFQGTIIAGPPGVHAGAYVGGPVVSAGVHIAVPPPPSVHIGVSVGAPAVVVGAPPPVIVGAPVRERVIIEERGHRREHHDNGRHEGWYKH